MTSDSSCSDWQHYTLDIFPAHRENPLTRTFMVNIIGCFIIGLFFGLLEKAHVMTPGENVLLITGFCGGFTTFSSFADDMWVLGSKGEWSTCVLYLAASVVLGVLLVWAGRALIR
ncbi:CrcB family protein [uncultured Muribaculum sp.]|uniref:fluoride efflux transporter FluC n=2 Tax=uncultured Muribaculum sp. TaxID=1918613 RepID=UPI0025AFF9C6|nr:CrcB family protein [uncultured Muribaculum sp.]